MLENYLKSVRIIVRLLWLTLMYGSQASLQAALGSSVSIPILLQLMKFLDSVWTFDLLDGENICWVAGETTILVWGSVSHTKTKRSFSRAEIKVEGLRPISDPLRIPSQTVVLYFICADLIGQYLLHVSSESFYENKIMNNLVTTAPEVHLSNSHASNPRYWFDHDEMVFAHQPNLLSIFRALVRHPFHSPCGRKRVWDPVWGTSIRTEFRPAVSRTASWRDEYVSYNFNRSK